MSREPTTPPSFQKADWATMRVRLRDGTRALAVYRRRYARPNDPVSPWVPWVLVAPSALLAQVGARGNGLYALRPLKRDDRIGRYTGKVVWSGPRPFNLARDHESVLPSFDSRDGRLFGESVLAARLPKNPPGQRHVLLDGSIQSQPPLQNINDVRGTRLRPNVHFTPSAWCKVTAARIPRFNFDLSLAENVSSELRTEYGDDYWNLVGFRRPYLRRNVRQRRKS